MSDSFATPWSVAHQALLSVGFSRQEYWSGLLCSSPGDLPNPGIEPVSLVSPALQAVSLPSELGGKPRDGKVLTQTTRSRSPSWRLTFWAGRGADLSQAPRSVSRASQAHLPAALLQPRILLERGFFLGKTEKRINFQ